MLGLGVSVIGCDEQERTTPVTSAAVVPAVVGTPFGAAVRALESAGLHVEATPLVCPSGTVTAQDTPAGEQLVRGSTVTLTLTGCPVTTSTP